MPAKSKKQQRYMGMVRRCQKTGKCASQSVKDTASSMKEKDVEDFASTKHSGLPDKKESFEATIDAALFEGQHPFMNKEPDDRSKSPLAERFMHVEYLRDECGYGSSLLSHMTDRAVADAFHKEVAQRS